MIRCFLFSRLVEEIQAAATKKAAKVLHL
ncbi:hypothetical protein CGLO_14394 [Colletotrichum gloeosporioides Cg-14]|uniref:Uncharacterized protein n=1 Tax=Colletotrichum gloeosporioides (strain Cg-14) TaxID=1237896 RepID=T0K424_COLGC|nr:hypothetical protein CGLO_14394 [Colletotrichum gloeosporioides Cg-14]